MTSSRALTPPGQRSGPPPRSRGGAPAAALAGLLAAAVALGVAELVAVLAGPTSSPIIAVGAAVIDLTPRPVKEFAIVTFGEQDKIALLVGTSVLLVLFALATGLATLRRTVFGIVGVGLFGAVGMLAAATRPTATLLTPVPSLVGALAGIAALVLIARTLPAAPTRTTTTPPTGATTTTAPTTAPPRPPSARRDPRDAGLLGRLRAALSGRDRQGSGLDRRGFLLTGLTAAGVAAVAGAAGRALLQRRFDVADARAALDIPTPADPAPPLPTGVDLDLDGLTPFTTPTADFYRVDTALVLPQITPESWSLRIHGRVRDELTLSFQDLLDRPLVERDITLTCVSNEVGGRLAGHARWTGVRVADLLDEVGADPDADQLFSTSSDGWTCSTPTAALRDGRDALLVVAMNGEPLPVERGFPVRMLVPGLYGYVSATKWLVDMELTSFADRSAYWTDRGWDEQAPIKVFSRIDLPVGLTPTPAGRVVIAGVAWAQRRGIERVEIRIADGDWQPVELAPAVGIDSWRQWSYAWDVTPGSYSITVRATASDGEVQPEERVPPFPNGATGWHSIVATIT